MPDIHPTAIVDEGAEIGEGTRIWHWTHVCSGAKIGKNCVLGQNVYVGSKVRIGDGCKIQNNVSIFDGVLLEENVFVGPSAVFTNVKNPRAHVERKDQFKPTVLKAGSTIGANATIVCGVDIGEYALVGAGSVVTKDVAPNVVVSGNPAKPTGVISDAGITE